jgi:hypothetical protein
MGIDATGQRLAALLEAAQGRPSGHPDVEAAPGAAPETLSLPPHVAAHLVDHIETGARHQALRQAERHTRVIGPLPGLQAEGAASHHVFDRLERPRRLEFERGAEGVARSKAK